MFPLVVAAPGLEMSSRTRRTMLDWSPPFRTYAFITSLTLSQIRRKGKILTCTSGPIQKLARRPVPNSLPLGSSISFALSYNSYARYPVSASLFGCPTKRSLMAELIRSVVPTTKSPFKAPPPRGKTVHKPLTFPNSTTPAFDFTRTSLPSSKARSSRRLCRDARWKVHVL